MGQISGIGRVLRRALSDGWFRFATMFAVNLLWVLGTLTIVLAPPVLFGMFYVANEAAHSRSTSISDFFSSARRYFFLSWRWGILNLIAAVLFWGNFTLYPRFAGQFTEVVLIATLFLLVAWVSVQFYTIPYLMELEKPSLRVALRNAIYTALASPLLTVVLVLIGGVLVIVLPALIFFGAGALLALVANHALLERLEAFGLRKQPEYVPSDDPLLRDDEPKKR